MVRSALFRTGESGHFRQMGYTPRTRKNNARPTESPAKIVRPFTPYDQMLKGQVPDEVIEQIITLVAGSE